MARSAGSCGQEFGPRLLREIPTWVGHTTDRFLRGEDDIVAAGNE